MAFRSIARHPWVSRGPLLAVMVIPLAMVVSFVQDSPFAAPGRRSVAAGFSKRPPSSHIRFVERSLPAGPAGKEPSPRAPLRSILEVNGSGVALLDADGDGLLDVYLAGGSTLERIARGQADPGRLLRNAGQARFEDAAEGSGLDLTRGWGTGVAVGDVDADGLPDILATAFGPDELFHNLGGGRFEEVASAAGVATPGWSTSAAFADADGDGDVDLYVARYLDPGDPADPPRGEVQGVPCLWRGIPVVCGPHGFAAMSDRLYRNRGDGTFEDVTAAAGAGNPPPSYGLGVLGADLDRDGAVDWFVANDSEADFLLWNQGGGRFEEGALFAGVAFGMEGEARAGMGVAAGDVDGDGLPDLIVTNFSEEPVSFFRNEGGRSFREQTYASGLGAATLGTLGWGTILDDLDGDADLDLLVANGHVYPEAGRPGTGTRYAQPCQLFENTGGGRFLEVDPGEGLAGPRVHRALASGDLDGDGDPDIVATVVGGPARVFWNVSGPREGKAAGSEKGGAGAPPGEHHGRRTLRLPPGGGAGGSGAVEVSFGWRDEQGRVREATRLVTAGGSFQASSAPEVSLPATVLADSPILVRWPGGVVQHLDLAALRENESDGKMHVLRVEEPDAGDSTREADAPVTDRAAGTDRAGGRDRAAGVDRAPGGDRTRVRPFPRGATADAASVAARAALRVLTLPPTAHLRGESRSNVALALGTEDIPASGLRSARALLASRRFEEALAALAPLLSMDPPPRDARFLEGLARIELHDIEGARKALAAEVLEHPDHAEALAAEGLALGLLGEDTAAARLLEEALRRDATSVEARFLLGAARFRLGDAAAARELLEGFVAAAPFHEQAVAAQWLLGQLARARGDEAAAAEHFRRHARLSLYHRVRAMRLARLRESPSDPPSLIAMGLLAFERGDAADARRWFLRAVAADATSAKARFLLGEARRRGGDRAGAEGDYREALGIDPLHTDARLDLALLLARMGRSRDALVELSRFDRDHPGDLRGILGRAEVLESLPGRGGDALDAYEDYLRRGGRDPRVILHVREIRMRGARGAKSEEQEE